MRDATCEKLDREEMLVLSAFSSVVLTAFSSVYSIGIVKSIRYYY